MRIPGVPIPQSHGIRVDCSEWEITDEGAALKIQVRHILHPKSGRLIIRSSSVAAIPGVLLDVRVASVCEIDTDTGPCSQAAQL